MPSAQRRVQTAARASAADRWERFPDPPIVEAILFIEVLPPLDLTKDAIRRIADLVGDTLPRHERLEQTTADFAFGSDGLTVRGIERDRDQHRFIAEDGQRLLQLRHQGIAFNMFAPYPGWERFRSGAQETWRAVEGVFPIEHIARIGVRYVNRINLPDEELSLGEFLNTAPTVPSTISTSLAGFFLRLLIPDPASQARAIMRVGIEPPSSQRVNQQVLTIDIDATLDGPIDSGEVWNLIDQLRDFKNRLFFESITDRTRELFR